MIDRGEHPAATQQERAWLREVAMAKLPDLNTADLDAAERIVAGAARSTGVEDQEKDET